MAKRHVIESIHLMRTQTQLCDVELIANDSNKFYAHKLILAANSDYLKSYFTNKLDAQNQCEPDVNQIKRDEAILQNPTFTKLHMPIDCEILSKILDFVYLGNKHFHNKNCTKYINNLINRNCQSDKRNNLPNIGICRFLFNARISNNLWQIPN